MDAIIKLPIGIFTFAILAVVTIVLAVIAVGATVIVSVFVIICSPIVVFQRKSVRDDWFQAPGKTFAGVSFWISTMWGNWSDALLK
jgi:hypothetical protein